MRIGKIVMTWVVAWLMIVDSASACRWSCWSYCGPCYSYSYSSCYSSCTPCYPADDCPICGTQKSESQTTHRAPSPPATTAPATPPPTLEPPAAKPAPAEPAPEPPAPSKPAPDLFEPPSEPAPMPTPSEPATPAPPAPSGDVEDLFKEPAATPPAEPSTPSDVEDLFKEPATPEAPAEKPSPDVEDLFKDNPLETPPAEKPSTPDDVDDLFKDVDDKNAGTPTGGGADSAVEDLFSEPTDESSSSASTGDSRALEDEVNRLFADPAEAKNVDAMRLWTDNTGKYHVRARLVMVTDTHVRLLKENGKYTTVPFERLSREDLAFARRHAGGSIVASF